MESRLALIVNNFKGFIYTISRDYKIEFMNRSLISHLGGKPIGEDCFRVIQGLSAPCAWCPRDRVLAGESISFEQQSPRDERWYYYVAAPQADSQQRIHSQQIIALDIHERKIRETELVRTQDHLKQENILLKSPRVNRYGLDRIVGQSFGMQEIYNLIMEVAASDAGVIIYGESGTGKELVANAIHNLGKNKHRPFVPVNCGGIPETLVESEFFGFKKGAFTGAAIDKSGFLEVADKGTLFLDEIGELNVNMQVKLLRALDGDGFTPLGGRTLIKPDIRIISATNRDLEALVQTGRMRSDFFFRINVVPIHLPPLRKRREDIPLLIYHFLRRFCKDRHLPHIPPRIMNALEDYDWPGNVRELQNVIHRYVALKRLDVFEPFVAKELESPPETLSFPDPNMTRLQDAMAEHEKQILSLYLKKYHYKHGKIASALGINRKTLYYKIKKHGL